MTQVSTAELASWLNSTLDIARFKDLFRGQPGDAGVRGPVNGHSGSY